MTIEPVEASPAPDPARAITPEDLGRELSLARELAGMTVRQVAREAQVPPSTAGDYFVGRHLPAASQAEALRKIVRVCGITDPDQVETWVEALGRVRRAPGRRPAGAPAPYRGLAFFDSEDAEWFFGRDELVRRLTSVAAAGALGMAITVTGASGSGKSSLLRAGLMPRLRSGAARGDAAQRNGRSGQRGERDRWHPLVFVPGASPMSALIKELSEITGQSPGDVASSMRTGSPDLTQAGPARLALIVDQFEEIFTSCPDDAERRDFVAALSALSRDVLVVLGLRADFYGHALRHPELAASLQQRQVVVGPMTTDQLRQVITEPARKARLTLDPGLADLMLTELAPAAGTDDAALAGHEAGTLPLLSHALRATWERSRGSQLTVADYRDVGGIRNAVARTAEAAYEALDDASRDRARQLFLRLVRVSDDTPLTRAKVPLDELPGRIAQGGATEGVLARFVEERLVTVDEHDAQITHEALLRAWPRLRDWIATDQEGLKTRHRISSAALAWQEAGRDDEVLLRGAPLAVAAEWAGQGSNRDGLSPLAREFVDSAVAHEHARMTAERRRVARLRRLSAALTALTVLAGGLAAFAFQQRHDAAIARDQADSREVAVEAEQIRGQDPSLAAQLSLAAYQISPTQGALGSLLESASYPAAARFRDSASVVQSVALTPDDRTLAAASADGTVRLWNVARPSHPVPLGRPLLRLRKSALFAAAVSPDGHLLAAGGQDKLIRLWNISSPRHPVLLGRPISGPGNTVYSVAFSPDGQILAAGSADNTVRLWDIASPSHPVPLGSPLTGPSGYVQAVAFSPSGKILAAGSADKTVRLWDISVPGRPVPLGRPLTGPTDIIFSVTFSPDGRTLAAGSRDKTVWLWNVTNPAHPVRSVPPLTSAASWVNAVAFSPDGRALAAASSDNQVLLWNTSTGALLGTMPGPQPVTSVAWDGNGTLIAGGADGLVRLWKVPSPILLEPGTIAQVSFSPHGNLLASAGSDVRVWDTATRTQVASVPAPRPGANTVAWSPDGSVLAAGYFNGTFTLWRAKVSAAGGAGLTELSKPIPAASPNSGYLELTAFSPDGRMLATGADDGTARLWNVTNPASPQQIAAIRVADTYVFGVAFSPGGKILATASADNMARLWDISDPAHPRLIGRPLPGPTSYVYSVAFSPDGRTLAVSSADKSVRLWNVTNPARPRLLGAPLTGPGGYVYSVAFSPDGRTLAAGSTDGSVWFWNVANVAAPMLITHVDSAVSPTGHVYSVSFSAKGGMLAAGSSDGSIRLWDVRPSAAVAMLCRLSGQPLTRAEWASYIPGRPYSPPCTG